MEKARASRAKDDEISITGSDSVRDVIELIEQYWKWLQNAPSSEIIEHIIYNFRK